MDLTLAACQSEIFVKYEFCPQDSYRPPYPGSAKSRVAEIGRNGVCSALRADLVTMAILNASPHDAVIRSTEFEKLNFNLCDKEA